jgi:hypothetical protein
MERVTLIARDLAKGYSAIIDNDRLAMMLFGVLALAGPYIKAHYGMITIVLAWCGIAAYWGVSNAPKSKRLDKIFHEFTNETGCYLLRD